MHYTASARVDEQKNRGNEWHIPLYPGWGGINDNPVSVTFDKYSVEFNGNNNSPNPVTPFWFDINNSTDENCDLGSTHHGLCPVPEPTGHELGFAKLIDIALDSMNSAEFNEETKWKAKVALYEKLLEMPEYLDSSAVLANFFASYAGSVIQKIAKMNIEIEKLFAGQQSLVQIMTENATIIYNNSVLLKLCEKYLNEGGLEDAEMDSIKTYHAILVQNIRNLMTYNNTAIDVLESTLSANVDLLNAENQSNNGTEIYEMNEKVINEAFFESVATNDLDNLFNYAAQILNVAVQCPIAGGPAVHRARSLYFLIDSDMEYDDANTCLQNGYLYRTSRNVTGKSKLYPNPASTEITLVYNVTNKSHLQILDCLGRMIAIYNLNNNDVSLKFDVSSLANGIYNYRIANESGEMIDTGQFVVNK